MIVWKFHLKDLFSHKTDSLAFESFSITFKQLFFAISREFFFQFVDVHFATWKIYSLSKIFLSRESEKELFEKLRKIKREKENIFIHNSVYLQLFITTDVIFLHASKNNLSGIFEWKNRWENIWSHIKDKK